MGPESLKGDGYILGLPKIGGSVRAWREKFQRPHPSSLIPHPWPGNKMGPESLKGDGYGLAVPFSRVA